MEGGVESRIDRVIPELIELFETYGYDTIPAQVKTTVEEAGLELVSLEDYEDMVHGN